MLISPPNTFLCFSPLNLNSNSVTQPSWQTPETLPHYKMFYYPDRCFWTDPIQKGELEAALSWTGNLYLEFAEVPYLTALSRPPICLRLRLWSKLTRYEGCRPRVKSSLEGAWEGQEGKKGKKSTHEFKFVKFLARTVLWSQFLH